MWENTTLVLNTPDFCAGIGPLQLGVVLVFHFFITYLPTATDIILQNMELQTDMGLKCVEILHRGEAIPDDMVLKMIEDKVNSPEVAHHGLLFWMLSESAYFTP